MKKIGLLFILLSGLRSIAQREHVPSDTVHMKKGMNMQGVPNC
jgi:hypothetical protein